MSQFRDNSWLLRNPFKFRKRILSANDAILWENMLSNSRSKSVLKSLRCRSSGRSKSKSKSNLDLNKIYADTASIASSSANSNNLNNTANDILENNEDGQVQVSLQNIINICLNTCL